MKKKMMSSLLMIMTVVSLAGCGEKNQQMEIQPDVVQEVELEKESNTVSDEMQSETGAQETNENPVLLIEDHNSSYMSEDGINVLLTQNYCSVTVQNEGFDALKEELEKTFPAVREENKESEQELLEAAKADYEFSMSEEGMGYFTGYNESNQMKIARCDQNIVSLCSTCYYYTGGAHGNYTNAGYNFDVKTGAQLSLDDILTDKELFTDQATTYICEELKSKYQDGLFEDFEEQIKNSWNPEYQTCWYFDATGLVISYDPYAVGPYAMGEVKVVLPYAVFGTYIKDTYLPKNMTCVSEISFNHDFSALAGLNQEIRLLQEPSSEDEYFCDYSLAVGTEKVGIGTFDDYSDAYLIRREDERVFVIISVDYASDDYVTMVYEVTDGDVVKRDEVGNINLKKSNISTTTLDATIHMDILGTYYVPALYRLTKEGMLELESDFFPINTENYMTVTKELPVTVDGTEVTLPVETRLKVTGTNGTNQVTFETTQGQEGVINLSSNPEEFGFYINGISEYEYFDMIYYAG